MLLGLWLAMACQHRLPTALPDVQGLPSALVGHAEVLRPDDPAAAAANAASAVKSPGMGGVSAATVLRLTTDVPVWRAWNGPDKKDANGYTNRFGGWWAFAAPTGTQDDYRRRYEVCRAWNDITWMATCTLHKGAIVAVGPGQSVSAETCGAPGESYAANAADWQLYIDKMYARQGPGKDVDCPPETDDRRLDPTDLSK